MKTETHFGIAGLLCLILSGCGNFFQTLNSSAEDEAKYGSGDAIVASAADPAKFRAAREILIGRCVRCHSEVGTNTEAEFKASSTLSVAAGDPASSTLYRRIKGAGVGGNENMPPAEVLTSSELQQIRDWILTVP
ncbi:MAG: hypothetical protein JNL01_12960 [Bdellovibrionales bacterium]|nr:hypothetical protein [Bdellovibrionales bacterium]